MNIYTTNEWPGYGKQNFYHNEYRLEGNEVVKYLCRRYVLSGDKDRNLQEEKYTESWKLNDPDMPDWLKDKLK